MIPLVIIHVAPMIGEALKVQPLLEMSSSQAGHALLTQLSHREGSQVDHQSKLDRYLSIDARLWKCKIEGICDVLKKVTRQEALSYQT